MKCKAFISVLLSALCVSSAFAEIGMDLSVKFDFQNRKSSQPNVTWSDGLKLTDTGLFGDTGNEKSYRDVWVRTGKTAVGLAIRPPSSARLTLDIQGEMSNPYNRPPEQILYAYIRYGCDGKHWSGWTPMELAKTPAKGSVLSFESHLSVPQIARNRFYELTKEWQKTQPEEQRHLTNDDEISRWIAKNYPSFFAEEFPFIGYVEVLIEGSATKINIKNMELSYQWMVGGKGLKGDTNAAWHFEL